MTTARSNGASEAAEHVEILTRENNTRRQECVRMLLAVALDYFENGWELEVSDPHEFVRIQVVETFRDLAKRKEMREEAKTALDKLRAVADPSYFD